MGNISYAVDVLEGVQTAIAEIGEQATISRSTQMRDPANPTKQITVTEEWTVIGALMGPVSRFDNATQTVRQVTQWYTDLLSVQNSVGAYLNTIISGIPAITWVSKEGDTVTLSDGTEFVLLQNEQPRISGIQCAAFHEVAG